MQRNLRLSTRLLKDFRIELHVLQQLLFFELKAVNGGGKVDVLFVDISMM